MSGRRGEGVTRTTTNTLPRTVPPDLDLVPGRSGRGRHPGWWVFGLVVLVGLPLIGGAIALFQRAPQADVRSGPDAPPVSAAPGQPTEVEPPRSVAARASAATVLLTWRKSNAEGNGLVRIPPDGEAIAEKRLGRGDRSPADEGEVVRILRDGTEIAERRLGVGRYLDEDVAPATSYTYLVQTRAADARASEFVKVTVETATPPLSAARLADVFDVRFDLRSSTGFDKLPSRSTAAWRFRPSCRQGPCDVAVSDDHGDGIHRVALTREQGRYGGSGTGRIGYACGSTPTTSSFSIDAYVLDADVVNDVWRATKLGGTLRVTQSQQLGCTSGSILMGFTATLVTRN